MRGSPIPPPYFGQYDRWPLAAIQNPYAEIVTNYNLDTGVPILRNGCSTFASNPGAGTLVGLFVFGDDSQLIAVYETLGPSEFKFYNVTSGTPSLIGTVAGAVNALTQMYGWMFGRYLYLASSNTAAQRWDGTTFTTASYASATPVGNGAPHKNRNYFKAGNTTTTYGQYGYGEIDGVTGTSTTVDLATILTTNSQMVAFRSIALSEGIQQENVAVFIFANGDVLCYSGSYPNSPNWGIVGRFKLPRLISYTVIDVKGDAYVMTTIGPISLRSLFTQGITIATEEGIAASRIPNRWKQLSAYFTDLGYPANGGISGVYNSKLDRIEFSFPYYVSPSGTADTDLALFLIYSFANKCWFEHTTTTGTIPTPAMAFFNNYLYFGASNGDIIKKEAASGFLDISSAYSYQLRTAPIPVPKFGANTNLGFELICKSDLYSETNFKWIGDLGQLTTSAQTLIDQGTGIANPMVNVGIEATYSQIDISGTTVTGKTVGQEIYALNIWTEQGLQGSR